MSNAEWDKLKEALRKPATPEAMQEAAQAFRQYTVAKLAEGRGSRPTLVSLGLGKTYPHAIDVSDIPQELERNPEFYKLLSRIVAKK